MAIILSAQGEEFREDVRKRLSREVLLRWS
jgi:hypothetical protein